MTNHVNPSRFSALEKQYEQICYAHAAITNFRSALLALLPIAVGGGILLLSQGGVDLTLLRAWAAPIGIFALAVTSGLFVYELRQISECIQLRYQGAAIEDVLAVPYGVGQFRDGPPLPRGFIGVEFGSWIVYVAMIVASLCVAAIGVVGDRVAGKWILIGGVLIGGLVLAGKARHIVERDNERARRHENDVLAHLQNSESGQAKAIEIAAAICAPLWSVVYTLTALADASDRQVGHCPLTAEWYIVPEESDDSPPPPCIANYKPSYGEQTVPGHHSENPEAARREATASMP